MTNPSEREIETDVDELRGKADTDDDCSIEVCCSWKDDCEHDEHEVVADFSNINT